MVGHSLKCAFTVLTVFCLFNNASCSSESHGGNGTNSTRFQILVNNFHHVQTIYLVTCWLLAACVLKILFHMVPWLPGHIPESAALITLGIVLGLILKFSGVQGEHYKLDSDTFFLFMLPPIVFDSGFHMPNRAFFGNLGTILTYAVIGTCFNATCIGLTIYGICKAASYSMSVLECLLYGSLISAVDPVGVLSVFEEVHVNEMLYIIVFGESLLNDAVTVVLYNVFQDLMKIEKDGSIEAIDIVFGFISFFVVALGGVAIGVIYGLITSFTSRFTDHVRVIEPIFIFIFGYLSYLTAEMVRMSGILAAVFCGITMRRYVNANVHRKSQITINYSVKMLAVVSETVVFMFVGMTSVLDLKDWNPVFFFTSLAACAIFRPIGVVLFTFFTNRFRTIKLTWLDQFIMSYGGLRGPIAYALCALIKSDLVETKKKDVLLSACMGVIFFTVYIQGGTIRFLVEGLHVKRASEGKPTMNQRVNERLVDHTMAGIEEIVGLHGSQYLRVMWESFDSKFLKPLLLREVPQTREQGIIKTFSKLNVRDAIKHAQERGSSAMLSEQAYPERPHITHPSVAEALNLNALRGASSSQIAIEPSDTALDLQVLNAPVRKKDVDDATARHILDNAMYKPKQHGKTRLRTSRTTIKDEHVPITVHNPHTKWQIRELLSGGHHEHHKTKKHGNKPEGHRHHHHPKKTNKNLLAVPGVAEENEAQAISEMDGGLEMRPSTSDRPEDEIERIDDEPVSPGQQTAAESQLPWRRSSDGEGATVSRRPASSDKDPAADKKNTGDDAV